MRTAIGFLKQKKNEIVLYVVLAGTFAVVSYLYDTRMDAVEYAFLLSAVWFLLSGIWDYLKFAGKHKRLLEAELRLDSDGKELSGADNRSAGADTLSASAGIRTAGGDTWTMSALAADADAWFPRADTLIEEDYQRIIARLYEAGNEAESAGRIARQEMMDYYGMWVHQIKTPIAAMHVLLQAAGEGRVEAVWTAGDGQIEYGHAGKQFRDSLPAGHELTALVQYTREMKLELFKIEQYVEMVLTYLRMEDMSSDMSFEICELDSVIRQAVRKYSQMFILKKIKLEYTPVKTKVLTDEKWLVFVMEQILSNALKYTRAESAYGEAQSERGMDRSLKQGKISIYMEAYAPAGHRSGEDMAEEDKNRTAGHMAGAEYCLVIEDTGLGICPEDLPRVFEKGFTGYNGRTDKKSTGIGLYLCKSVMDKLRHQMWIESEVGKGTKVYLSLARKRMRHE